MEIRHSSPASESELVSDGKVMDFASASQDNDPNLYPGQRPDQSYLTNGNDVYHIYMAPDHGNLNLTLTTGTGTKPLDEYLHEHGVPLIDERLPFLAFGANMAPGSLATKFRKDTYPVDGETNAMINNRPDLSIVPTVYAELPGHDVVWSGGPGVNGNFIAMLYDGPEAENTTVQVGINFLTREQVLLMHATELSYNLSTTEVMVAGQQMRTYYYGGKNSVYMQDGKPVAVQAIPAHGRALKEDTTESLLTDMLRNPMVSEELAQGYPELFPSANAHEYITALREYAKGHPNSRLAIKRFVHQVLADNGLSKVIENPNVEEGTLDWANPSRLANHSELRQGKRHNQLYRLPSQELPKEVWRNQQARQKVLRSMAAHLVRTSGGQLAFVDTTKKR